MDSTVSLGIEYDPASVQSANKAVDSLRQELGLISDAADDMADSTTRAAAALRQGIADGDTIVAKLRDDLNSSAEAADNLADSLDNAGKKGQGLGSIGGGSSSLRTVGRALDQVGLGAIGRPIQQVGDIQIITRQFDELGKSLDKASGATKPFIAGLSEGTVALGEVVIAGAVFVGGLELIHSAYEKNTQIIQEALARTDEYYKAIDQGTTDSLKKQLDAEQAHQKAIQAELDTVKSAGDNAFQSAQQAYGDLGARALFALGQTGLYGDTLKDTTAKQADLTKQLEDSSGKIAAYKDALNSSTVAANDATAAEQKLIDARLKSIDPGIQSEKDQFKLLRSATTDQTKGLIQDRLDDIAAVKEYQGTLAESAKTNAAAAEEYNKLTDRIKEDQQWVDYLRNTILPLAEAREKEAAAVKDLTQAEGVLTQIADATKKYNDDTTQLTADRQARDLQEQQDFQAAEADKKAQFYANQKEQDDAFNQSQSEKRQQIYQQADENLAKALANVDKQASQYQQQEQDKQRQLVESIQTIWNDANANIEDAASRLDSRAVKRLEDQRDKQIKDTQTSFDQQKEIRDRDEAQKEADARASAQATHDQAIKNGEAQLEQQQDQYEKQRQKALQNFQRTLDQDQKNEDKKLEAQKAADAKQDAQRKKAYQDQLTSLDKHLQDILDAQNKGQSEQIQSLTQFWAQFGQVADSATQGLIGKLENNAINSGVHFISNPTTSYSPGYQGNPDPAVLRLTSMGRGGLAGRFADGGIPPLGKVVQVGERGPEYAVFGQPASILGSDLSKALTKLVQGGGNGPLVGTQIIQGTGLTQAQLSRAMDASFRRMLERAGR